MTSISSLMASAGVFGLDTTTLKANADSLTAAAQAKSKAATVVKTPWSSSSIQPDQEKLVRSALAGKSAIEATGALTTQQSHDAQSLFKLYNGVQALSALATKAALKTTTDFDRTSLQRAFDTGVKEAQAFVDKLELAKVTLIKGDKLTREDSALVLSRNTSDYVTGTVQAGAFEDPVESLAGDVKFSLTATRSGIANRVDFDLAEMGATPRTIQAVADYVNGKLEAAGVVARFSTTRVGTPNADGRITTDTFGFKIKTLSTEKIVLAAPDAKPALVVAGGSGVAGSADARLTKITGLDATPASAFAKTLNPEKGDVTWRANAVAPDGGYFAVGETTVALDGTAIKSSKDAVVAKYDSTGKLLWTKNLGAAGDAAGLGLAVSSTGEVAIVGSTAGRIGADIKGGTDAFVTVIDSNGVEKWTQQVGTSSDDKAVAVAFDASGNVIVGGNTKGTLVTGQQVGGSDNFIQTFSSTGALVSRQQFGSSGEDSLSAIAVADDGQVIVSSLEDGRGVLRKLDVSETTTGVPTWTQDLGELGNGGGVFALTYDQGAIYVGGRTTLATADVAQGGEAAAGGEDGFIARYDDGATPTKAWGRFIGTSGNDQVRGLVVADGALYATGDTTGILPGATQVGTREVFAARLSATDGALGAVTQVSGSAGVATAASVALDPKGDSSLNLLGLPNGSLSTPRSSNLVDRAGVRVGDSFYVSVNGGSKRKVTIEAGDDWTDLSFKLNAIIGLNGRAAARTSSAGQSLRIETKGASLIEFSPGPSGRDALGPLGLTVGTVHNDLNGTATSSSAPAVVALGIDNKWSLTTAAGAVKARDDLDSVLRRIRNAYESATAERSSTSTKPGKTTGTAPAYLTAQLQNYTAALNRLQGTG